MTSQPAVNEGQVFYKQILGSPTRILAPMVAQSELPWRLLARRRGCQLCYTPMWSSLLTATDPNYAKMVLDDLGCKEDRPLIVQFCANRPDLMVQAAKKVEEYCDGVDLNLGCPQNIARKGNFGSFLQDNWEVIEEIIRKCRQELKIGVSAKIRVFPDVEKSIEYAKMLERAGCHFITVHGRTKEQRGEATGLADWEQIRRIREAVGIPVVANGNVQYHEDIGRCIEETGVDGVMIAEGHLTNPAIFQPATFPDVCDAADEYLDIVEGEFPLTNVSHVRAHLFRLWKHSFKIHTDVRDKFGPANSLKRFRELNEEMRQKCKDDQEQGNTGKWAICSGNKYDLPHWKCQPYVRPVKTEEEKFADGEEKGKESCNGDEKGETPEEGLTKNEMRRQRNYQRKLLGKKLKRKKMRENKKEKVREMKLSGEVPEVTAGDRRRWKERREERVVAAMAEGSGALKFCVDLGWCEQMNKKEVSKLAGQLARLYGANRNSPNPAHLYFAGFSTESHLKEECRRKHEGFDDFKVTMTSQPSVEMFQNSKVVYLTPDAPDGLETVDCDVTYIVGGLVDETVSKRLTLGRAEEGGVPVARLPIEEHMRRSGCHKNYSQVSLFENILPEVF